MTDEQFERLLNELGWIRMALERLGPPALDGMDQTAPGYKERGPTEHA